MNLPVCNSIGASAFSGCKSLSGNLNLPACTSIGSYAFYGCSNLTSINLQPDITRISDQAFDGCSKLSTLICNAVTPPSIATTSFSNTPIASKTGTIYVPDESVDAYKTATNWVNYASIIKPLSEYVES